MHTWLLAAWLIVTPWAQATDTPGVPVPGDTTPAAAPPASLHIVYTGGTGGLGADRYTFGIHRQLSAAADTAGLEVLRSRVQHGVLHQGDHVVVAADGLVATAAAFVRDGTPRCDAPVTLVTLSTPTERAVLPDTPWSDTLAAQVQDATHGTVQRRRCTAGGVDAWWMSPADAPPILWDARAFDVRLALGFDLGAAGEEASVLVLGLPRLEAARRAHRLLALRAATPDTMFVDGGDFVDGASTVRFGETSLHRATGFDLLSRLDPAALVPGANELASGPAAFLLEARTHGLPYVAANWSATDPDLDLPDVLRRTFRGPQGDLDVAFVGIIDPIVQTQVAGLAVQGVTLTDPLVALRAVVDSFHASDAPPDLVVLVSYASPDLQARLRRLAYGVDLFIGDRWAPTVRVQQTRWTTAHIPGTMEASPITLPMDGVATAEVQFADDHPVQVTVTQWPVVHDDPADPRVRAAITKVRLDALPQADDLLLPTPPEGPLATVSHAAFAKLACEAVLEATQADIVLLPVLPEGDLVPGPLTSALAASRLAVLDKLELHRLDGDRANDVLELLGDAIPTACGGDIGRKGAKVGGRSLNADLTYRIVTTDRARLTTDAGSLLDGGNAGLVLQLPRVRPLLDSLGQPRTLQNVALNQMRAWRDRQGSEAWTAQVLARSPATKEAAWLLDIDKLSLQVSTFGRTERPDAYAEVPETLINSPASLTIGGALDLTLRYDGTKLLWDARAQASYVRLAVADADAQETADDWQVATSLSLPVARFPRKKDPGFMPYLEARYDAEFTPLDGADGTPLPRQADLSGTIGLSATSWKWLKRLRLGAFLNQDMGRLPGNAADLPAKGVEAGGRLELQTQHDLAKASSVRIKTALDGQVFAATPQDDAADLRLRLFGEVRLQLRLIRWLDVSLFGQGLVAQGRVPETSQVVASGTVGASIDMAASFLLRKRR